ncbi:VOC family protein [Cohaesibacter celericrescens]|uniref:VOC domain-containing protein n=1 Tax=Cohaesibacter celericrescens TaxID=2067669 RepID=A0A2N5XW66_9HYPH|nr:VOC family protein [Cohaesibacter celericrescens]PLW78730.1 hypothetical protein C0081_00320 [Cohaesibacter celericrescens]
MTNLPKNAVTWFSIPATDFEKSISFFQGLLGVELIRDIHGEGDDAMPFAMFPKEGEDSVSGAVTPADRIKPAAGGVLIYLACNDIDGALERVDSLGGALLTPKTPLPGDMGDIAVVADCDGTPIGLHQV